MVDDVIYRAVGFLKGGIRRLRAKYNADSVNNALENLYITLKDEELDIRENSNPDLPRMAYFTIQCENRSHVPFDINKIRLYVELEAENTPNRKHSSLYPVANILCEADSITNDGLRQVHGHSTQLGNRTSHNIESYDVEIEIPPWIDNVSRMHVHGYVTVQWGVVSEFTLKAHEENINT